MIDRILIISKQEVVITYFDKPSITVYSDVGAALYYAYELLKLDEDYICTTLKAA